MKRLSDLFISSEDSQEIDLGPQKSRLEPSSLEEGILVEDIFLWEENPETSPIDISENFDFVIEKKRGNKSFDALEKKNFLHRFFRYKTLNIEKKIEAETLWKKIKYNKKRVARLSRKNKIFLSLWLLGIFLLTIMLDILFVQSQVRAGYERLSSLTQENLSYSEIQKNVNNARLNFILADAFFLPFKLVPGEKRQSISHVILGGKYLSSGLDDSLWILEQSEKFIENKSLSKVYFSNLLVSLKPNLEHISSLLQKSIQEYKDIDWLPNSDIESQKTIALTQLEKAESYLDLILTNYDQILELLGHNERKRYLVVFQNSDEIRPTGGFMGSMALVEIFRGRIQLFQTKDVYAIEWDLKSADYERLPAPKGINELTENFGLRDANYYANLKDSSNAINFFMQEAGIELDGIAYINQNSLIHLLEAVGSVYFPELETEINAENFSRVMSLMVESKNFQEGTLWSPKQILFDFMQVFLRHVQDDGGYVQMAISLLHDMEKREIMFWSFDPENTTFLSELWVAWTIDYNQSLDMLYPVYTSLSGNKSDRYMTRSYQQSVSKTETCDFLVNSKIISEHHMPEQEQQEIQTMIQKFALEGENLLEIQGAAKNRQYVRVLLPKGAQVVPEYGMDVVDYGARKGIEFFLETPAQGQNEQIWSYILENPECQPYSFSLFKQAGIETYNISLNLFWKEYEYNNVHEDFYFLEK